MDLVPAVSKLKIVLANQAVVPLGSVLNEPQLHLLYTIGKLHEARRPVRIVVLKARQLGLSTVIEATLFQLAMSSPRLRSMIISHSKESAQHLLDMSKHYWDTYWGKPLYTTDSDNRNMLSWKETRSSLTVATARNAAAGRSFTFQALHASEVAFWDNAETLMTGLAQTLPDLPNTYCFLESTANGVGGYFYDTYQSAKSGDSDYIPVFYPWFMVSKYSFPWAQEIPGYRLDAEERVLRNIGVGDPHLAWRRWAIVNKCNGSLEKFHQEYPSSDKEAFITSGTNVFPIADLDACYKPSDSPDWPKRGQLLRQPPGSNNVVFHEDTHAYIKTQPFRVYREPRPNASYMVSGDPTRTIYGDNAAIQVIDRRTMEVVAQWRGKTDPSSFADRLIEIGVYYNWAMIVTEINGPGTATIQRLLVLEYPNLWQNQAAEREPGTLGHNYGWASSQRRKNEMIGHLLRAIVEHDIIIHDEDTYNELRNYVALDHGQFGNSSDEAHDDLVTSLAIGLTALIYEAPTLEATPGKVDPMNPRPRDGEIAGNEIIMPRYDAEPPPWEQWEKENQTLGDFDPLL